MCGNSWKIGCVSIGYVFTGFFSFFLLFLFCFNTGLAWRLLHVAWDGLKFAASPPAIAVSWVLLNIHRFVFFLIEWQKWCTSVSLRRVDLGVKWGSMGNWQKPDTPNVFSAFHFSASRGRRLSFSGAVEERTKGAHSLSSCQDYLPLFPSVQSHLIPQNHNHIIYAYCMSLRRQSSKLW